MDTGIYGWRRPCDTESNEEKCNLGSIQVSGVLHCARVITIVSLLDNRVKELSEHLNLKKTNTQFSPF